MKKAFFFYVTRLDWKSNWFQIDLAFLNYESYTCLVRVQDETRIDNWFYVLLKSFCKDMGISLWWFTFVSRKLLRIFFSTFEGSNTLSELRDFIKCPIDFMIPDDVSDNPFATVVNPVTGKTEKCWDSKKKYKDIYKSGFFYIEGCFYNDMRLVSVNLL